MAGLPLEGIVEGVLSHREDSPTAANAHNRKFGSSGAMVYTVLMQTGMGGIMRVPVTAATGDEAADLALAQYPGGRVAHIEPAPKANG